MNQALNTYDLSYSHAGVLVPPAAVVIGGTWLLDEFFDAVAKEAGGELAICSAFIDEAFTGRSSNWQEMRHPQIDICVVTSRRRDARNARSALRVFPWRSLEILECSNLHAKIYSFVSHGRGIAMVGSHNLTRRALAVNIEAGVLFKALTPGSDALHSVLTCHERIGRLAQRGRVFMDTKHWPRPDELDRQEDSCE